MGYSVTSVSKELFHMTDTYVIQVNEPEYALDVLMFVLAIDAENVQESKKGCVCFLLQERRGILK